MKMYKTNIYGLSGIALGTFTLPFLCLGIITSDWRMIVISLLSVIGNASLTIRNVIVEEIE